jgi:hypothetical protein
MLAVQEVAGKGRGVFATRDIGAGEVVLTEQPLMLYPQQGTAAAFCSHCLRAFNSLGEQGTRCSRLCTAARAHSLHRRRCRQPAAAACCLPPAQRVFGWPGSWPAPPLLSLHSIFRR